MQKVETVNKNPRWVLQYSWKKKLYKISGHCDFDAVFCLKLCYFCQILLKIYDIHVYKVPYTNSVNSRIESCSHTLQGLLFIYFSLLIEVVFYVIKNLPTLFFLSICNVGSQLFGGLNKFLQNMSKWYLILVRQMLKYISEYILWYYFLLTCRYYYYLEIQESRARSSDSKKIYSGFVKSCFPVTGRLFIRI